MVISKTHLLALFFVAISACAQSRMVLDTPIYPEGVDAKKEIRAALVQAKAQNKHVLLVFGADWCYDCHVLDYRFHSPEIEPFLDKNFVVVHVNIGRGETNVDLSNKYHIPVDKGVPSIAVVSPTGALLYSTQHGEISPTRRMPATQIVGMLENWAALK
ncbi:putative thiol-disulfide isomerase and thioredoxin [Candidatus Koribacter versatilis Ellin345]|uniref:Thiol-disulfide isomerase and thioredoxin n=1 Tax=Koribacter versatilis (strain Ellin345) TaxID=204669 RepID=Q1IKD1_KORVE|nr:thioredoxin family protein [Candidatus Koribacter versatilis]ABF42669.1 putative thiol-disulfide isomerase and thioredoxin [Candidatus Koribacter versatilis Ellin345]